METKFQIQIVLFLSSAILKVECDLENYIPVTDSALTKSLSDFKYEDITVLDESGKLSTVKIKSAKFKKKNGVKLSGQVEKPVLNGQKNKFFDEIEALEEGK